MAQRHESVVLSLDDRGYSTGMARAAAATLLLDKSIDKVDGKRLGSSLSEAAVGADRVGTSSRSAGPEIDRLSGRLRLFTDVALTLGPALVPLGASTIPVLTGALMGLGAASGGIVTAVLAFQGLGDALESLNTYQAEPTAENLQAMRVEMEKLGPAGEAFTRYIDSIGSELSTLQIAAREGLFPGLEEGVDLALQRLPGVRKIVGELAEGMGELATSAGDDLAPGGDWDNWFRYLDTDGKATLVSFGQGLGDIANGLANMMVAFAPVTRDFTNGFEDMAQSFADWSAGLSETEGFQDFLQYVRESGPQAIDFLGSLVDAMVSLAAAAAPIGSIVLPALTRLLDVVAGIASSPIGPALLAGAAGLTAYSRAAELAAASQARFTASMATRFAGLGPAAAIAGVAVAAYEMSEAFSVADDKIAQWNTGLEAGTLTIGQVKDQLAALEDDVDNDNIGEAVKNLFDPDVWQEFLSDAFKVESQLDRLRSEASFLGLGFKQTGDLADLFGQSVGQTGQQMRIAAGDAQEFSASLAELNGWFDKRQAMRDYNESVRTLAQSMRNGFTRQDVINLDDIGRNMLKVAQTIKDPGTRATFLDSAKATLEDLAERGGPKAQAAIEKVLAKMEALGLIEAEPTVDPDTSGVDKKTKDVKRKFDIMDALAANPVLDANANPFYGVFNPAMGALNKFDGRVATATLNVIRVYKGALSSGEPSPKPGTVGQLFGDVEGATGGYIRGPGTTTSDSIPALLSDREYVIRASAVDKYGVKMMHAINAEKFATGGQASGGASGGWDMAPGGWADLPKWAESAAWSLKSLEKAATAAQTEFDKQKSKLADLNSVMESVAASVASKFDVDLGMSGNFSLEELMAQGLSYENASAIASSSQSTNLNNALGQATADASVMSVVAAALKAAGLTGAALAEAIAEMSPAQLQALAANPGQAAQLAQNLGGLYSAQQTAGTSVAQLMHGEELRIQIRETREAKQAMQAAAKLLAEMKDQDKDAPAKTGKAAGEAVAWALNKGGGWARHRGSSGG